MVPHTEYQVSRPCGSRQEDVCMFLYIRLCGTCDPRASMGHNLNKRYEGHYQGSRYCVLNYQGGLYNSIFCTKENHVYFLPFDTFRRMLGANENT